MVIQSAKPWISESIESGQRWRNQLAWQLEETEIGVVCLCPDNLSAPSIHFEAGALSRRVNDDTRLIPYCVDLLPADLGWPLSDFQGVVADEEGTWKLIQSINSAIQDPRSDALVRACFDGLWSRLKADLDAIPVPSDGAATAPKPESIPLSER